MIREYAPAESVRLAHELDLLLEVSTEGIFGIDARGRCTLVNRAAAQMLRYGRDELLGRDWHDQVHNRHLDGSPYPSEKCPILSSLHTGQVVHQESDVFWRRDGAPVSVEYTASPISEGGVIVGAIVAFADISERERAEQAERQRDELARAVSHDLRNPLAAVLGQAQLLQRRLQKAGLTGPELQNVQSIIASAQRMNTLIQDLVDATRQEAGRLRLERQTVDLPGLAQDLLARQTGALETNRIHIEPRPNLPPVSADPPRLERILVNLLSNALKYSPPDSTVEVRFAQHNGEVVTSITDRGPAIPPEALPHLFDRSYPAQAGRNPREGEGLGLYIVKILVEAHGGRVWVESEPEKGNTFYFTLPVA